MPPPNRTPTVGARILIAFVFAVGTGLLAWQWWAAAQTVAVSKRVPVADRTQYAAMDAVLRHPVSASLVPLVPPLRSSNVGNANPFPGPLRAMPLVTP